MKKQTTEFVCDLCKNTETTEEDLPQFWTELKIHPENEQPKQIHICECCKNNLLSKWNAYCE